jgi:hypothetical protein
LRSGDDRSRGGGDENGGGDLHGVGLECATKTRVELKARGMRREKERAWERVDYIERQGVVMMNEQACAET